jgi:hypothetical protein
MSADGLLCPSELVSARLECGSEPTFGRVSAAVEHRADLLWAALDRPVVTLIRLSSVRSAKIGSWLRTVGCSFMMPLLWIGAPGVRGGEAPGAFVLSGCQPQKRSSAHNSGRTADRVEDVVCREP